MRLWVAVLLRLHDLLLRDRSDVRKAQAMTRPHLAVSTWLV